MKLRSSRGEYWPEAICKATMVRANTRPVTVIMVADTTTRIPRASSAVPWNASGHSGESASTDTRDSLAPAVKKTMTDTDGSTHRAPPR
jgi:hypothetical protein